MKRPVKPGQHRRRLGLAVPAMALGAVVAASFVAAGASALAAAQVAHGNYRGPARPAHAAVAPHLGNYRGAPRASGSAAAVHGGSNVPANVAAQRASQKGPGR